MMKWTNLEGKEVKKTSACDATPSSMRAFQNKHATFIYPTIQIQTIKLAYTTNTSGDILLLLLQLSGPEVPCSCWMHEELKANWLLDLQKTMCIQQYNPEHFLDSRLVQIGLPSYSQNILQPQAALFFPMFHELRTWMSVCGRACARSCLDSQANSHIPYSLLKTSKTHVNTTWHVPGWEN